MQILMKLLNSKTENDSSRSSMSTLAGNSSDRRSKADQMSTVGGHAIIANAQR
jgi:hypothetical protein